jgi:antitoxin MazE
MKVPIVPIGNSKGIRLSKTLIEKYDLRDSVELI